MILRCIPSLSAPILGGEEEWVVWRLEELQTLFADSATRAKGSELVVLVVLDRDLLIDSVS